MCCEVGQEQDKGKRKTKINYTDLHRWGKQATGIGGFVVRICVSTACLLAGDGAAMAAGVFSACRLSLLSCT